MKPVLDLAKESFRSLHPCVHGADVFDAASKLGVKREVILDFSSSVNPLGPSEKALEALKAEFGRIPSYPDSCSDSLREAIAKHYFLQRENVIVGNGSTELIYLFAEAFMREGDEALIPAPSFGEYENAIQKTGQKFGYVSLGKDFRADSSRFVDAMTEKTKIVYFCNPNNPTSILIPPKALAEVIQEAFKRSILVFLDEDFLEFVEGQEKLSMISMVNKYPNLFVLRSFTKIFGLTGLRVGYGIASEPMISILMNGKLPWNVNCLAQAAAVAALRDTAHIERTLRLVAEERAFLVDAFSRFEGLKVYSPDANFVFMNVRGLGLTAADLKKRMLGSGVLIRDCTSFVGLDEYYVRVAVRTRCENELLLAAFEACLR